MTETATAEAEMKVSNEQSVTPENFKELVAKGTKISTAALLKEITKLKTKVKSRQSSKESGVRTQPRGTLPK